MSDPVAEAEARIIAWLRRLSAEMLTPDVCAFVGDAFGYDGQAMCSDLADMIEAGDHRKETGNAE